MPHWRLSGEEAHRKTKDTTVAWELLGFPHRNWTKWLESKEVWVSTLRPGAQSKILKWFYNFQTLKENTYMLIKDPEYKTFSPAESGVWQHGNDKTQHTNRFHSQTFPGKMEDLRKPYK